MAAASISVDEFQALEQKVLQTVELIKKERELRSIAATRAHELEATVAELEAKLARAESRHGEIEGDRARLERDHTAALMELSDLREKHKANEAVAGELDAMKRERESVRQRVESMLTQLDELL
jgi:chromosome segregation ATPase